MERRKDGWIDSHRQKDRRADIGADMVECAKLGGNVAGLLRESAPGLQCGSRGLPPPLTIRSAHIARAPHPKEWADEVGDHVDDQLRCEDRGEGVLEAGECRAAVHLEQLHLHDVDQEAEEDEESDEGLEHHVVIEAPHMESEAAKAAGARLRLHHSPTNFGA